MDINFSVIFKYYLIHILLFCLVQLKEKFSWIFFLVFIQNYFKSTHAMFLKNMELTEWLCMLIISKLSEH